MHTQRMIVGLAVSALLLGALAIGFTQPGPQGEQAQCGPHGESWEQFLQEHDADGSGTLSADEFPGPDHAFTRIDADGNGQITEQEAVEAAKTRHERRGMQGRRGEQIDPQQRWERWLEHQDANGDGVISKDEFNGPEHAFTRLDANEDGQITQEEALATPARRGGDGGPGHERMNPEERWARMLEHLDADGSGTISQDEFPGRDEVFARIDADGDGQITQDEMQEAAQRMRQRKGNGPGNGNRLGARAAQ